MQFWFLYVYSLAGHAAVTNNGLTRHTSTVLSRVAQLMTSWAAGSSCSEMIQPLVRTDQSCHQQYPAMAVQLNTTCTIKWLASCDICKSSTTAATYPSSLYYDFVINTANYFKNDYYYFSVLMCICIRVIVYFLVYLFPILGFFILNLTQNSKIWRNINKHRVQKRQQHCFVVHNCYKFKHIVVIFGEQHRGCIANLLLVLQQMFN